MKYPYNEDMMRIKYRVYHYDYRGKLGSYKYDHLDLDTLDQAIAHYYKSRTAREIFKFEGTRRCEQINPRTGLALC